MRTAIYARISDDRHDGAGVERQLKDCRSLVKRQGWEPAVEYRDNDISAFSGKKRPQYLALLGAIRSGEIGRIVVYHADRLYRKPRELEDLIDLAEQGRVQIASCHSGELDLANSDGRLVARMLIGVAAKESEDKSRRIKSQKQQARERGQGNGGPRAFGWMNATTVNPPEADLVRHAIADLLAGASLNDIARRWNAAKVPQPQARSRKGWTANIVRLIVVNPRVAGLIGHRTEKRNSEGRICAYSAAEVMGKANWSGIVDRPQWERLMALLERRGANGRIPRRRSLLTGLVTCATCGGTMVRSGARGRDGATRKVWRCMAAGGGHGSIGATELEALLIEATLQRADTTDLAAMVRARGRQGRQAVDLVNQLEELDHREDAAAKNYAAGKLPMRAFELASAAIQREKRSLQGRLAPLTATTALEPYAGRKGVLRSAWPALSVDQQRAIIAAALGSVTVSPTLKPGRPTFDQNRVKIAARSVPSHRLVPSQGTPESW